MSRFYVTTPIYYVNDVPHLGHAYTTIVADALARFHRAVGDDTRFLTGTDEHGLKIEQAAAARGLQPIQLADQVVERFRSTWQHLDVKNDDFIRTTEPRHKQVVTELWNRIAQAGDLYPGSYQGWYCVSCEAYYAESELAEGKLCPTHKKPATWLSEPTYFFRMSRYQEPLLAHFASHPGFVQPENYKNEVLSFIRSGLRDLSVSRTTFHWGIPVPGDPTHVIYVWIDALTNYLSALGPIGGDESQRYWPASCHLIGKDILKFHAVYWPAMLLSAGLPLPERIFTHGWWTVRGEKISKSMPATRVDPNQLADDLGIDALRYYLLREVPLGLDGDFTYENLIGRYNAELAHDLGNLVSRALTMAGKFTGRLVPPAHPELAGQEPHQSLVRVAREVAGEAAEQLSAYAPSRALEAIWRLVREANRYVNDTQPWVIAREPSRSGELEHSVRTALEAIAWIARLVAPVMPRTAGEILELCGAGGESGAPLPWPEAEQFGASLTTGAGVGNPRILFPRIDPARQAELIDQWVPGDARAGDAGKASTVAEAVAGVEAVAGAAAVAGVEAGAGNGNGAGAGVSAVAAPIELGDFSRIDLRAARVISAEPVARAKKLLRLLLEVGEDQPRQVVAGIALAYRPEDLVGRTVIFLANLKPATIRGVTSQGMILAAGDQAVVGLSAIDRPVPPGTRIK